MSTALVLAEPEPETRGFLARHLAHDGFDVLPAEAPESVAAAADLVLLGDADALDRWRPSCPVIVIGAEGADAIDRVRAFERGCDDFVARPFAYEELLARIRAVLRRVAPPAAARHVVGDLVVDLPARRAAVEGRVVPLAGREFELLATLAAEPDRVFTKEQLLQDVWRYPASARTRTVDSHASRLRRKLTAAGGRGYVVNVWGVGYKLVEAEVAASSTPISETTRNASATSAGWSTRAMNADAPPSRASHT